MDIQTWMPLIGVAVGWVLSHLDYRIRRSQERGRDLRLAVSRLMFLVAALQVRSAKIQLAQEGSLPDGITDALRPHLRREDQAFRNRYEDRLEDSIESVARVDPVHAQRLRAALELIRDLHDVAPERPGGELSDSQSKFDRSILETARVRVREVATKLAWKVGPLTWWRVRRTFDRMESGGDEARDKLADLQRRVFSSPKSDDE